MNQQPAKSDKLPRPFLGVNFAACRVYGRLYKNHLGTAYEGHCPRCGKFVQVPIGGHGTSARFFIFDCGP